MQTGVAWVFAWVKHMSSICISHLQFTNIEMESGPVVANLGGVTRLIFLKIVDVTLDHIGAP